MVQRVAARPGPSAARPPATAKSPVALVRGASASVQQALASTLGMEGERMSKVDTAWLRMDSPSNLMMIVGVWILRPGLTPDA
jgi:diacylglycerol O-acyltransferase / wax synthase